MSTTLPDHTEVWSQLWREVESTPAAPDLRKLVARDSRRLFLTVASECVVALGLITWSISLVLADPSLEGFLWIASLLAFLAIAVGFTTWNRRGLWRVSGNSTSAYVTLCIDRCYSRLLSARFAMWLLVVESVFVAGWRLLRAVLDPAAGETALGLASVLVGLLLLNGIAMLCVHFYSARVRGELERYKTMRAWLSTT
jgi:hypothetical protein